MAPRTNKAKAAGIGASSFLDLKAELAAKEKEIAENRAVGKKTASSGQKPGKVSDFPPLTAHPLENAMLMRFFSAGRGRNRPCGAGLIKASRRGPRRISSSRLSHDRRSKPRTRFWNESREFTRNLTRERTPGYQKSNTGHCLSM